MVIDYAEVFVFFRILYIARVLWLVQSIIILHCCDNETILFDRFCSLPTRIESIKHNSARG